MMASYCKVCFSNVVILSICSGVCIYHFFRVYVIFQLSTVCLVIFMVSSSLCKTFCQKYMLLQTSLSVTHFLSVCVHFYSYLLGCAHILSFSQSVSICLMTVFLSAEDVCYYLLFNCCLYWDVSLSKWEDSMFGRWQQCTSQ